MNATPVILLLGIALALPAQTIPEAPSDAVPSASAEQPLELVVTRPTEDLIEVDARAKSASLREAFVALAGASGRELKMQPGILPRLDESKTELNVRRMDIEQFASLLAGTAGLEAEVKEGEIFVRHRSALGTKEAGAEARYLAGSAWSRAGLHSFTPSEQGALYRIAVLFFAGEEWARALDTFKAFLTSMPNDPRAARARLLAGYAAMRLERYAESRSLLGRIEDEDPQSTDILPATLLLGQVFLREGRADEALIRLRRVINEAREPSMRSEAILQRTKMWFELKDWKEALASIEEYDEDLERRVPGFSSTVALARGLARQRAAQVDRSFLPLQFAWLQMEDPSERLEAILALAAGWQRYGEHLLALQTLDLADALTLEPWQRLRLLEQRAAVLQGFMLLPRLEKTWREMAELGLMDHPDDRSRTLGALEGLANLLFEQQRFADARRIFASLKDLPELSARAITMLARCEIETANYEQALLLLDSLNPEDERVDLDLVVRLRGECWLALGDPRKAAEAFRGQLIKENAR